TVGGQILPVRELDSILFDLPDIVSSAGSVYIKADVENELPLQTRIEHLVEIGQIVPNAGARIDIQNRTPISMSVNDAIIEDNRRIEAVGGSLVVFTPGNVYLNGVDLTHQADDSAQDITIFQDALLDDEYDLGGFELPPVPQDLYIAGDVINEAGNVTITNREGSINVSGIIRGEQVEVISAKNFSLNTEGWYHTNQDPRQYIDYTLTNNTVFHSDGTSDFERYFSNVGVVGKRVTIIDGGTTVLNGNTVALPDIVVETPVPDVHLDQAIARNDSRIVAQGRITITAQYLNINGLIQSGTDHVQVDIASTFAPPARTTALANEFNQPLAGVSFGSEGIPVDGYWDAANHRIVIEEIVPQGGEIILAGQIISTGNGLLRVANGYTDVTINNASPYALHIERIDVTTNKEGRIQITETSTGDGSAAHPFDRVEYTYSAGQVVEQRYDGVIDPNGFIEYTTDGAPIARDPNSDIEYQPVRGSQYFWVEGQSKTQTTVK